MNKIEVALINYSECSVTQKRLATFTLKSPKFLQAHLYSHRTLSRSSASSRAIPSKKLRGRILSSPFMPIYFGENKPGMRSGEALKGFKLWAAQKIWLWSRYVPVFFHWFGEKIGIHKEVINRLIEPWMMTEVVLTGTEWANFIALRAHIDAQPEMEFIAREIEKLLKEAQPRKINPGEWHMPFIRADEELLDLQIQKQISAARCARVSYLLFDGKVSTIESDIALCKKLTSLGHWSPFEHQAEALGSIERVGNFVGWKQYRKEFENENRGDYLYKNYEKTSN